MENSLVLPCHTDHAELQDAVEEVCGYKNLISLNADACVFSMRDWNQIAAACPSLQVIYNKYGTRFTVKKLRCLLEQLPDLKIIRFEIGGDFMKDGENWVKLMDEFPDLDFGRKRSDFFD